METHIRISPIPEKESPFRKFAQRAKKFDFNEMLKKITPNNLPDRTEFEDSPVGKEIW